MSIEGIWTSLPRVQESAAVKVASMAISDQKQQGKDLMKLLSSSQITDPALGNRVDFLA